MSRLKTTMIPAQTCEELPDGRAPHALAGLYVLTRQGSVARLDVDGTPVMEPGLTAALSGGIETVLGRYRSGEVESLCLGVVVDAGYETAGAVVFSDGLLNEMFDSGRLPGMPLTRCESRNKSKTVFQAMELLLNKKRTARPYFPYFCPVLISAEVDAGTLGDRYGPPATQAASRYEILDLSEPFLSSRCPPGELFQMRAAMRGMQTAAGAGNSRTPWDRRGADPGHAGSDDEPVLVASGPAAGVLCPAQVMNDTFFKEGDPVTGWLLEWFSPFNELTETQREIIAGYETIRKAVAGARLIERGTTEDICVYLVEGVLELITEEGDNIRVSGGTRRSRLPISVLSPHAYDVTAVVDSSVIVFSQKLVHKINEVTRTYTGVNRAPAPEASTAAISNGAQSVYFTCTDVTATRDDS